MFILKIEGENYYLVQGPTGYGLGRSKKRAVRFDTEEAALQIKTRIAVIGGGNLKPEIENV